MERGEAVIHIVNKFKVKAFRCIMIYQDVATGFCIIRPLLSKIDFEIVMELFKIFTAYGPPKELHVYSCTLEMVDNMDLHMKGFCPMFNIKFIKKNVDNNKIAMKVVTRLHDWMEQTKKVEWEIGCLIIQRQINKEVSADSKSTPQELFFKSGREKLAEDQNISTNVSQEQKTANKEQIRYVKKEQGKTKDKASRESSIRLSTDSLGTVKIKEEIEEYENYERTLCMNDRMVLFDGGLIFSCSKKVDTNVEIKMERRDE